MYAHRIRKHHYVESTNVQHPGQILLADGHFLDCMVFFWNLELIDKLKSWDVFTSLEKLEDKHHWGSLLTWWQLETNYTCSQLPGNHFH